MVTVEANKVVMKVNQSKVKRNHDEWHDVPLPDVLTKNEPDEEESEVPAPITSAEEPEGVQEEALPDDQQ